MGNDLNHSKHESPLHLSRIGNIKVPSHCTQGFLTSI